MADRPARPPEPASPLDWFSWSFLTGAIDSLVQKSPAWTVSLSLHVLLLLVLALFVVRQKKPEKLRLDMAFSTLPTESAVEKGVEISPTPEPPTPEPPTPEPVEKTEVVEIELPPVEMPVAAPPIAPVVDALGSVAVRRQAVPIGTALNGRDEGRKKALVEAFGGNASTEMAVAMALDWVARQQNRKDGLWSLQGPYADGGSQENRLAATAMALLAFQGAGNTTQNGPHADAVKRGWSGLLSRQRPEGDFDAGAIPSHHALYAHAQATIALCEIYGMTKDESFAEPATRAVAYAVAAQGPNGGWRYDPGANGDMSVTGWFMMALKTAEMAGMKVPPAGFEGITRFLDLVANEKGTRYGYRREYLANPATPITAAVSAEGLLCRQYLGWPQDDPRIAEGLELLMAEKPFDYDNDKDLYAWYYITQVAHHAQGAAWERWNDRLREVLPVRQVTKGREKGSWDPSLDKWGHIGGRLYATSMAAFMLEVYYRHMPVYAAP